MIDPTDEELTAAVGHILRVAERPPAFVLQQARDAFAWRGVSSSLAQLDYDSLLDDGGLARVRSSSGERRLGFSGPAGRLHLSVIDGVRRLAGRIEPAAVGAVSLHHPSGTETAEVDRYGNFIFDTVRRGPVSVSWQPADHTAGFHTEWVTI